MCKILGKEFQQYLPVVMGPLMKTASIKPEVALLDSKQPKKMLFVPFGDEFYFFISFPK